MKLDTLYLDMPINEDWKGLGRKIALGAALGAAGVGLYSGLGKSKAPSQGQEKQQVQQKQIKVELRKSGGKSYAVVMMDKKAGVPTHHNSYVMLAKNALQKQYPNFKAAGFQVKEKGGVIGVVFAQAEQGDKEAAQQAAREMGN